MNRAKLKTYAPQARKEFIQAVTDRAAFHGLTVKNSEPITEQGDVAIIAGKAFPRAVARKRKALEERINHQGFEQTMEALAYTWFNRFVAVRFMELHGYFDHGYRVLSHPEGKGTPEILEHVEHVELPRLDKNTIIDLKLDGGKEAELYRLLLIAQCNALHEAMPFLFERIDDETELLLPDNLLHSDSLIRKLVNEIDEEDWREVEIIGWLYQFYISEKKDQVIGKVVKSEDIPAATQIFTPNWIVKYLVQNSLGRQWLATYPTSTLRQQMEYYIEPAEQTPEVQAQLQAITPQSLNPEELTLLDPACGSGHILVEAYDLFKAIYQERGYRARDIPALILRKNLFGLEIDDRAAQLAAFALMMKARVDDRRIFANGVQPNVLALQESKGLSARKLVNALNTPIVKNPLPPSGEFEFMNDLRFPLFSKERMGVKGDLAEEDIAALVELFANAKTFGSLIQVPSTLAEKLPAIGQRVREVLAHGDLETQAAAKVLLPLFEQAWMLSRQYDAVVANPPYLGMRAMNPAIRSFAQERYPSFKLDTYAIFVVRSLQLTKTIGIAALVTMHSWMFLHRYEAMRQTLLRNNILLTLAHLGARAFSTLSGEVVQTCAFTISPRSSPSYMPLFIRCVEGEEDKKKATLAGKQNLSHGFSQNSFLAIEGAIIAYWASHKVMRLFQDYPRAEIFSSPRHGMVTSDNDRFLRDWWDIPYNRIGLKMQSREEAASSAKKWFPYNKGGSFRKWYGNIDLVINWENDGEEVIRYAKELYGSPSRKIQAQEFYFKSGISMVSIEWSRR